MVRASRSFSTDVSGMAVPFWVVRSLVGEERVEPLDAAAPDPFVLVQQLLGATEGVGVAPHATFAALRFLGHQTGSLQDGDVLLHGRERQVVGSGQLGDRRLRGEGAPDDVAPGGVGEGPEDPVDLVVAEAQPLATYNHLVVRYARRGRASTPFFRSAVG